MLEDIYCYILDIDIHFGSCIKGVNSKMRKILLDKIPDKFRHLFAISFFFGIFPSDWTCATVTLLPKEGEKKLYTTIPIIHLSVWALWI